MEASTCPPFQSSPLRHYYPRAPKPRAGSTRRERGQGEGGVAHYGASQRIIPSQARTGRNSNPPQPLSPPPQRIKKKDGFRKEIGLVASTPRVPVLLPHFTGDSCRQPRAPRAPGPAGKGAVVRGYPPPTHSAPGLRAAARGAASGSDLVPEFSGHLPIHGWIGSSRSLHSSAPSRAGCWVPGCPSPQRRRQ